MATVQELLSYYENLLIIQYNGKEKITSTVSLLVEKLLSENLAFDLKNTFDLDTATGEQLDFIAKYIGVNRFYKGDLIEPDNFGFVTYDNTTPLTQTGFATYADFETKAGQFFDYFDTTSGTLSLGDEDFRILIKLKIIQNNSNHSHKSIDDGLIGAFGNDIVPFSTGNMAMDYVVESSLLRIFNVGIQKGAVPFPMGVKLNNLVEKTDGYFDLIEFLASYGTFTRGSSATMWDGTALTSVGVNVPRFDTDPITRELKGLLIEEARTNLLAYSDDFSSWGLGAITVTSDATTSPDGAVNADKLTKDANSYRRVEMSQDVTNGTDYAFSVYVKAGTTSLTALSTSFGLGDVQFNTSTQVFTVATAPKDYGYEDVGDGWYRIWIVVTSTVTAATQACRIYIDQSGTTVEDLYLWRAQFEVGSFVTSPIETAGATATRSSDVNSTPFANIYNQKASTFFFKCETFKSGQTGAIFEARSTGGTDRISLYVQANGTLTLEVETASVVQTVEYYSLLSPNGLNKIALTIEQDNLKVYVNGVEVDSDITVTPPTLDTIWLGQTSWGWLWNGWLEKARYYPKILTASEIGSL